MRVRKWRTQGAEVVITMTEIPDGLRGDDKRLYGAVGAFVKALSAPPASPAGGQLGPGNTTEPQGDWVLVPREPTREMLDRAQMDAAHHDTARRGYGYRDAWLSMLSASPTPAPLPPGSEGSGGWLPIESAPRDGTEIVVLAKRAGCRGCLIAHWADGGGEEQPRFRGWFWWTGYDFRELADEPTHWMPLPEAPR